MHRDARTVAGKSLISAQVCIVGAGPAGIAIARELNGQDFDVILLESGGFEFDEQAQDLSAGTNEGDPYPGPSDARERLFGGTASVWPIHLDNGRIGVRYVPLDPIDFETRGWVPHSGWPISRADLDPYYARAHQVAQTGPYNYDPSAWETPDAKPLFGPNSRATNQMFQFGPRDIFTSEYRQELERSPNVTVLTYAHALEIDTDELAQTVTGVRVGALGGNTFAIAARIVILAQGGLESARLLLLSDSVQSCGLGNGHDLVGRFLMDHPVIRPGVLTPSDRSIMNRLALYDARWVNGARVIAKPILKEETQRQEQLLNINTAIFPRPAWARHNPLRMAFPQGQNPDSKAVSSVRTLGKALRKGTLPSQALHHMGNLLTGVDALTYFAWRRTQGQGTVWRKLPNSIYDFDHGGWSHLTGKPEKFGCFDLLHVTEQAPDPSNRITLSDDLDTFGYRRMTIHWRYNDIDRRSVRRAMEIFAEEFFQAGLGTMRFELDHGNPVIWTPSIHHPMGTTRMHHDPQHGVVDANCQVHGVSNLFIASGSVFPTGGYANPTLTVLALALRVADQVKHEMGADSLNLEQPATASTSVSSGAAE